MSLQRRQPFPSGALVPSIAMSLVLALLVVVAPAAVATDHHDFSPGGLTTSSTSPAVPSRSLTVAHGAIQMTLTTPGSDGHQLGDLRVASVPLASDGEEGDVGRIDGTLLTTGIDQPNIGDEVRMSTLIFTLGDAADQVVISGSGLYPAAGSTIAADSIIVRPITGGSGRFAGVTGWVETEHLPDDTWRHTIHVMPSTARATLRPERGQRLERSQRDERRDERRERRAPAASPAVGTVRTLLGETEPATAAGSTLGLWHYVIAPGESLVPHTHPGYQVARIMSGALRYEVISGEAQVVRADGSTEMAGPGDVVILEAGDAVIEDPDLAHFGANEGRRPVVIVTATLFESGSEPALPLEATEEAEPEVVPETSAAPAASATPAA